MADDPATGKDEAEEEEEQEGKPPTVNGTGPPTRDASRAVTPGETANVSQAGIPVETAKTSPVDSPLPTENASKESSNRTVSSREGKRSSKGRSSSLTPAGSQSVRQASSTVDRIGSVGRSTRSPTFGKTPSQNTEVAVLESESKDANAEDQAESVLEMTQQQPTTAFAKSREEIPKTLKDKAKKENGRAVAHGPLCGSSRLFERRSPFVHNPPYPEERRPRIRNPQSPKDYIINLREDLADFQESHGLPRTRDYSFMSLGLSLAQETGRAIYAVFLMLAELFPIVAIVSLILRFSLDKLIDILETEGTMPRFKKSVVFAFQLLVIMIPLWILIGTVVIPLLYLILSIFRRLFRMSGRKRVKAKPAVRPGLQTPVKAKK